MIRFAPLSPPRSSSRTSSAMHGAPFSFRTAGALAALALLLAPATTRAQPSDDLRLEVRVEPFAEAGPWKRKLVLRSTRAQEVVVDRRLLELTVLEARERGRPRRHACRHPNAPRRAADERVRTMEAGDTYVEWLDLRELCWGRALSVLERGSATVEVAYGFRARNRFVVREESERRPPHRVSGESFTFEPPPSTSAESPILVTLARTSTRGTPTFALAVRGQGAAARQRVYVRDDLFALTVRGPLGTVRCSVPRTSIVPIVDFYRRLSRPTRTTLSPRHHCPEGTFDVPGVYDVQPAVDLVYDGARYDLDAVTGSFVGEPVPVRITGGSYVEQRVEDLLAVLAEAS